MDALERRRHAAAILLEHDCNEWDGSADLDTLASATFAVIMARHDDSWVVAADTAEDVAATVLGAMAYNESIDAEWVETVYSIDTGAVLPMRLTIVADVALQLAEPATCPEDIAHGSARSGEPVR